MDTMQIYPESEKTEYPDDYPQWLIDLLEAAERKGFYRGVNNTYWFIYRISNGGKESKPQR